MLAGIRRAARFGLNLLGWGLFAAGMSLLLTRDTALADDTSDRTLAYLREVQFDFVDWTLAAAEVKLKQSSLGEQAYLSAAERASLVRDYFYRLEQLEGVEREIAAQYANPAVADPEAETAGLRLLAAERRAELRARQPLAEAVLQEQLTIVLRELGLTLGGQPLPPVAFHFTDLPDAFVVSPRDTIRQEANLDITGGLPLETQVALEARVARELDVSTLIVPLGGIGTYPTMLGASSSLNWIASVAAHEWVHNYLTLRPLGLSYERSPQLRTMNETAASLAGSEIGARMIARFYPDLAPPAPPLENRLRRGQPRGEAGAGGFDFRAEMHLTRLRVDELLAAGQVEAAEAYMEQRRQVFWDNGYQLRKLNQAYFAFYGAYADGGGAPGADPVGPAVRLLRRRSPDLAHFLNTLAWFTSFDQLKSSLGLK